MPCCYSNILLRFINYYNVFAHTGTGESDDNITSIVASLVVILVLLVLIILIIIVVLLVHWYRRKRSPTIVTIKFAIKDEPGSLAKALKVFKVNIHIK